MAVLVVLLLVIVVGAAGVITAYIKKYTPSDARMALKDYYKIQDENDVVLILQDKISETRGKLADGMVYVPYEVVTGTLGGRFYWDEESQKMLYTTAEEILELEPESSSYVCNKENQEKEEKLQKEKKLQHAMLEIKKKYGKNAILKGTNFEEGATSIDRNQRIGGHKA